jgi:hypothetical protein
MLTSILKGLNTMSSVTKNPYHSIDKGLNIGFNIPKVAIQIEFVLFLKSLHPFLIKTFQFYYHL